MPSPAIECPIHEGRPNGDPEAPRIDQCDHCLGTGFRVCVNHGYTCDGLAVVVDGEPMCAGCLADTQEETEAA